MRSVTDWLGEYGVSHQNPVNKLLHWICVPPIVLAVMGLLWSAPVPAVFADVSPWLNWATLAAAAALIYYLLLSPALAVGVLIAFTVLLLITQRLSRSEEHTSELQSPCNLVCRLLLEKKKHYTVYSTQRCTNAVYCRRLQDP